MLIVQKYGGSSVGNPEKIKKVAERIAMTKRRGEQVVVVVSAMGDTTDELLRLADAVTPMPHDRELDMLLTAGERISMALLCMALRDQNIQAISFTGSQAGIITDESHTRARILEIKPFRVKEELLKDKVVIVAGFQGVSRQKEITTLGRGGSDTTAVALAHALKADRCEILTDVAGVFSADPRVISRAQSYERLPLDLIFEMAAKGAQVMHPRAIEIAREGHFPVYLGLAHSKGSPPNKEGTMLTPEAGIECPKIVAVTAKKKLRLLTLPLDAINALAGVPVQHMNFINHLFEVLLDETESRSFLEKHSESVGPGLYSMVSVVGYQLQHNSTAPAKILEVLKTLKLEPAGLTCHPQSFTVWFSDSNNLTDAVVKKLHEGLIK